MLDRILTDEDFKRIEAAQLRKQMQGASKGTKRSAEEDAVRERYIKAHPKQLFLVVL